MQQMSTDGVARPRSANSLRRRAAKIFVPMAVALAVTVTYAADERIAWRWRAEGSAAVVTIDGHDAFMIEGLGPVWREGKTGRGLTDATVLWHTSGAPGCETIYRVRGGAEWTTRGRSTPEGDFVVELSSTDRRFGAGRRAGLQRPASG